MDKKESYKQNLEHLFNDFLKSGNEEKLVKYLVSNSNLPGPRGNLELAAAFADASEALSGKNLKKMWKLCLKLSEVSVDEAPVNNPKEFLPFCGTYAIGAMGSVSSKFLANALSHLQKLAEDSRWRLREAVAMGIQKLLEKRGESTLEALEDWIKKDNWLVMRAVAAGVAEPALLKSKLTAKRSLELHKMIFTRILTAAMRKSAEFKTLRHALGYSLSVVVCAIPEEGFEYMRQLLESNDADVLWIVKENLKKNRLIKNFPDEVDSMKKLIK